MNQPANETFPSIARANPFSTRFIRPGAIEYLFSAGETVASLVALLAQQGWRGQIIGPHGSGKSTLIACLLVAGEQQGRKPWLCAMHDGQHRMPGNWITQAEADGARLIVIDGYEQLGFWSRFRLTRACRQRGWGLLVTAHCDVGLPTVFKTPASVEVARAVVARLLPAGERPIEESVVDASFAASGNNVREMLFALYDRFEQRSRATCP